jgi:hypothetical protein
MVPNERRDTENVPPLNATIELCGQNKGLDATWNTADSCCTNVLQLRHEPLVDDASSAC